MTAPATAEESLQGRYAGFASRFVAWVVDMAAIIGVFMLALAAASLAANVVTARQVSWNRTNIVVYVLLAAWAFLYFAYAWGTSGKTFGMALLGIQVVRRDGGETDRRRGIVRTLVYPFSFILGLGFLGILFDGERRALHDVAAGTAVVYAWNARAARLRFLAREGGRQRTGPEPEELPAGEAAERPAGEAAELPAGEAAELPAGETAELPAGETAEPPAREAAEPPAREAAEPPAGETEELPVRGTGVARPLTPVQPDATHSG